MANFEKAVQFIWENARHLERAIFTYRFQEGSPGRIVDILQTYQNEDGGFGYALEPDLRASESQPLFVEFGLKTLYESGLRAPELAYPACEYLSRLSALDKGIPTLVPSSQEYPRAEHMDNPSWLEPSMDRLAGLVGLLSWQGVEHPWLESALPAVARFAAQERIEDAHTLSTTFILVESLSEGDHKESLFQKLARDLLEADYFCAHAPTEGYCLTPLDFAPGPNSYARRLFTENQIEGHLDELEAKQAGDGGWPIAWQPPSEAAVYEWRALKTINALTILRGYGRL
jgi:hypothetical protein